MKSYNNKLGKQNQKNKTAAILLLLVLLTLTITACTGTTPTASSALDSTLEIVTESSEAAPIATETETALPTSTPAPSMVLLLAPPGADPDFVSDLEVLLSELTSSDGLELQVTSSVTSNELKESVRLVVVVPPDPGITALAASSPETQFLAVGIPGLVPGGNLSVIGSDGERPDQQGFIAGYLAATITPGWRVGVISSGDSAAGIAARESFLNGVIFFCGLCRPSEPPFVEYPQFFDLFSGSGQAEMQAAADALISNGVQTVYVYPGAGDQSLLEYLAGAGVTLIGGNNPPDAVTSQWAASISPDWITPVREVWPLVISGEGSIEKQVVIVISDQNPDLFSPGRQRLVDDTLAELLAGFIDTGVDPITGELR